jgi:hypothetical protein
MDLAELCRLFQKACGIDGHAGPAFAEYCRIWQQIFENFRSAFCPLAGLWGWIPLSDYQAIENKCNALEKKTRDQDQIISHLRTLLDEKGLGQIDLLHRFQSLIQSQGDEFQTVMKNIGEAFTKTGD